MSKNEGYTNKPKDKIEVILEIMPLLIILGVIIGIVFVVTK